MSLYNKYRPTDFESIFGNLQTIESISNMISKPNPPHTYLLTGETGCGKTTVGRIIANKLGCIGNDLREINTADMRGIDQVRDIIKQAQYRPIEGPCMVWLIDECHKLTKDAQNAFLKLLEDTPSHVYFILCTTDPKDLLSTIKGRCSTFNMNPLGDREMLLLLRKIVIGEGENLEREIYNQIVQDSLGHPRNAIQVLEQVLNVEPGKRLEVAKRKAEEMSEAIELCRTLISGGNNWKKIAGILTGLKTQDPEGIRRMVLGYAQSILLGGQDNEKAAVVLVYFNDPFYNSGFPSLTLACYQVLHHE